jgi:hypothetical protein
MRSQPSIQRLRSAICFFTPGVAHCTQRRSYQRSCARYLATLTRVKVGSPLLEGYEGRTPARARPEFVARCPSYCRRIKTHHPLRGRLGRGPRRDSSIDDIGNVRFTPASDQTTDIAECLKGAKPRHPSRARDGSTNQSTLPLNFERLENLAAKIRRDGNPGGTIVKAVSLI